MSDAALIVCTEDELTRFDGLCERTGSRDNATRVAARIALSAFIKDHGKPKCDAMYAELSRRQVARK